MTQDSSSEDDPLPLDLDDESNDLNEFIDEILNDEKELEEEVQFEDNKIQKGDYALVKVSGKRKTVHYVVEIVGKHDFQYDVKFLVKTGTNSFLLKNETVYQIEEDDIVLKLPPPVSTGGSERQISHLKFAVNFNSFIVE